MEESQLLVCSMYIMFAIFCILCFYFLVTLVFVAYENAVMTAKTVKMTRLVPKFNVHFRQPSDSGFGSFSHQEIQIYTEKI